MKKIFIIIFSSLIFVAIILELISMCSSKNIEKTSSEDNYVYIPKNIDTTVTIQKEGYPVYLNNWKIDPICPILIVFPNKDTLQYTPGIPLHIGPQKEGWYIIYPADSTETECMVHIINYNHTH